MAQELVYTSAPRGLRAGSSGFCTVACTRGMAPNYVELLESLSAYTTVYPPHHPRARLNPTSHSHYRFTLGGRQVDVLSRVAFAGADYSGRANKFAHHLVVDSDERAMGGPAWTLLRAGVTLQEWVGEPRFLDRPRELPKGDSTPAPCDFWARHAGDAGWAGVLAQSFMDEPRQPAFLVFEPGAPMLELVAEALRLLHASRRWNVSFNTYFTTLPVGSSCVWRCCLRDSSALKQARRTPNALVLDLTPAADQPDEARRRMRAGSPLIETARTGVAGAFEIEQPAEEPESRDGSPREPRGRLEFRSLRPARGRKAPESPRAPAPPRQRGKRGRALIVLWILVGVLVAGEAALGWSLLRTRARAAKGANRATRERSRAEHGEAEVTKLRKRLDESQAELRRLREELRAVRSERDQAGENGRGLGAETARLRREAAAMRETVAALRNDKRLLEATLRQERQRKQGTGRAAAPKCVYRAVIRPGAMRKVASELLKKPVAALPLDKVAPNWRVVDVGWWPGEKPGDGVRVLADRGGKRIAGPHTTGMERITYVSFRAGKEVLLFRKGERANDGQLAESRLDKVAWITLRNKTQQLSLMCKAEGRVLLEAVGKGGAGVPQPVVYTARFRAPSTLTRLSQPLRSRLSGKDASVKSSRSSVEGEYVHVQVVLERPLKEVDAGGEKRNVRLVSALTLLVGAKEIADFSLALKR